MTKPTRESVEEVLDAIDVPGGTVLSQGWVRSLTVDEGRVGVALAANVAAEVAEPIREKVEAALSNMAGVDRALVALVSEGERQGGGGPPRPAPPKPAGKPGTRSLLGRAFGKRDSAPAAAPGRPAAPPPSARPAPPAQPDPAQPRPKRIIAVGSGKGGVGKSTVSMNLAVSLAALGWRVGLLDADIYGPSVPLLSGNMGYRPPSGEGMVPLTAHGVKVMSIGFLVEPEKAVVWRGPMATGALAQLLRDTKWGELDALLIDMPPGTGDIQLSLSQQANLTGAVLVTTPQDLALIDVRKAASMFATVNVPILGLVENMSTFICPHCGHASAIFGEGGGEREAQMRGTPFLGRVPLTMELREASDDGRPASTAGGPSADAFAEIAANLMATVDNVETKPFPEIVFE